MNASELSHALDELSWIDVAAQLAHDPRLIIPVGALDQHGPHLPLGSNVLIARSLAVDLSRTFGALRAPTVNYGVNGSSERSFAGTASLSLKTLHRALNELLDSWELHGVGEFILISAHRYAPHLEALTTLITARARVRVLAAWDVDISDLLDAQPGPLNGGEAETSVMLHLYPELVRMDRARDFNLPPEALQRYLDGGTVPPPKGSAGVVGAPSAASAEKGERIYGRIRDAIARAVFEAAPAESDTL